MGVLLGGGGWFFSTPMPEERQDAYGSTPFLRVTNREYALFLWQHPEFMRQAIKAKRGYLSSYLEAWGDRLTPEPLVADEWVKASTQDLFHYHTWKRLIGSYYYPRPILQSEFLDFLNQDPEWHPRYWKKAPAGYVELIKWIEEGSRYEDLKELDYKELPILVRQAFQGWKNFSHESSKIHHVSPTYQQLWTFIDKYPAFQRPYWINLIRATHPEYLKESVVKGSYKSTDKVPASQLNNLLKIALYNYVSTFSN